MKDESRAELHPSRNVKPDGGYGWIVCCGTFIVNFVVFGIHNSFGVVYVNLLDDLQLGQMQTGKQLGGSTNKLQKCRLQTKLLVSPD